MTEIELIEHQEKMRAARDEFYHWWAQQPESVFASPCRVLIEITAWDFFLRGKGLKQ